MEAVLVVKVDYHIYDIRISNKMSLRDLSDLSGVSKSQIDRIENGESHPTVLVICQIAEALNTRPENLFSYYIV